MPDHIGERLAQTYSRRDNSSKCCTSTKKLEDLDCLFNHLLPV